MTWSAEPPKEPGYYWFRLTLGNDGPPEVIQVVELNGKLVGLEINVEDTFDINPVAWWLWGPKIVPPP